MRPGLALFVGLLARVGRSRQDLLLENFALRHHLMLCERRPRVTEVDRLRWAPLRRRWAGGRTSLVILHPDTVGRWHRTGWRRCWTWKRRPPRPRRRRIPVEARDLILRRARENPRWGAVRIRAALRPRGSAVRAETVRRSRRQAMRRPPSQRWRTVLPNQRGVIWAADCCPVPTRTVGTVDVFFLIAHARRRIEDVTVTAHPTAAWTWQQLIEATAWNHRPRSLIRDRDRASGRDGVARAQRLGSETNLDTGAGSARECRGRALGRDAPTRVRASHHSAQRAAPAADRPSVRRRFQRDASRSAPRPPSASRAARAPAARARRRAPDAGRPPSSRRTGRCLTIRILWPDTLKPLSLARASGDNRTSFSGSQRLEQEVGHRGSRGMTRQLIWPPRTFPGERRANRCRILTTRR